MTPNEKLNQLAETLYARSNIGGLSIDEILAALEQAVKDDREQNLSFLELDYINKVRQQPRVEPFFYCNKCGYSGSSQKHEGCAYNAYEVKPRVEPWTVQQCPNDANLALLSCGTIVFGMFKTSEAIALRDAHNASIGAKASEQCKHQQIKDGSVVHHGEGKHGTLTAICMHCGRPVERRYGHPWHAYSPSDVEVLYDYRGRTTQQVNKQCEPKLKSE